MTPATVFTTAADADAADAIRSHHAELSGALLLAVDAVTAAASSGTPDEVRRQAQLLHGWCRRELLPHARAEEQTLYAAAAARPEAKLLVTSMIAEHDSLGRLVDELDGAPGPIAAVGTARALQTLFTSHVGKENDLLLPVLGSAPEISLAGLLAGMHDLVTGPDGSAGPPADPAATAVPSAGEHTCHCGHQDDAGYPELDARTIPHAIRHATIFGALGSVPPSGGMVLVAPHDPVPLLEQVHQAHPGRFDIEYLERGPQAWRLAFSRRP